MGISQTTLALLVGYTRRCSLLAVHTYVKISRTHTHTHTLAYKHIYSCLFVFAHVFLCDQTHTFCMHLYVCVKAAAKTITNKVERSKLKKKKQQQQRSSSRCCDFLKVLGASSSKTSHHCHTHTHTLHGERE